SSFSGSLEKRTLLSLLRLTSMATLYSTLPSWPTLRPSMSKESTSTSPASSFKSLASLRVGPNSPCVGRTFDSVSSPCAGAKASAAVIARVVHMISVSSHQPGTETHPSAHNHCAHCAVWLSCSPVHFCSTLPRFGERGL